VSWNTQKKYKIVVFDEICIVFHFNTAELGFEIW